MTPIKPVYAAFDFDGTITKYDPTVYFILYTKGILKTLWGLIILTPSLLLYLFGALSRQEIKERILGQYFSGDSFMKLRRAGEEFVRTQTFKRTLRPDALKRIQWHRRQGHECLIISASEDFYLTPFAKEEGMRLVISSCLQIDDIGTISGKLDGLNCRGPEKVRRLQEMLGQKSTYVLYAYGDSDGDKELLKLADYPFYRSFPNEELL